MITGFTSIVATVIAAEIALGLVFDSRWRDFPFAALTLVALPFAAVTLLNRREAETRPLAEAVFAGLFTAAALYILFNEGFRNWQSLLTAAMFGVFGVTLWQLRSIVVASAEVMAQPIIAGEVLVEQAKQRR